MKLWFIGRCLVWRQLVDSSHTCMSGCVAAWHQHDSLNEKQIKKHIHFGPLPHLSCADVCVFVCASRGGVSMVTDWMCVFVCVFVLMVWSMLQVWHKRRSWLRSTSKAIREMWNCQFICSQFQTCTTDKKEEKKKKRERQLLKDKTSKSEVKMSGTHSQSPVHAAASQFVYASVSSPNKALRVFVSDDRVCAHV